MTTRARNNGVFYISRDFKHSSGDSSVLMVSKYKPTLSGKSDCETCGGKVNGAYEIKPRDPAAGVDYICADGFAKVTGIKVDYGQVLKVKLVVVE